jgi:hypothetical protein
MRPGDFRCSIWYRTSKISNLKILFFLILRQMAIFFEKFLHNVRKSPVRIKLRISFQTLIQLAIRPSSCPREEMRQFKIYFWHLIRSGMLYSKTCDRRRFSILLYWLSSLSSLPSLPSTRSSAAEYVICDMCIMRGGQFLIDEILEILMLQGFHLIAFHCISIQTFNNSIPPSTRSNGRNI